MRPAGLAPAMWKLNACENPSFHAPVFCSAPVSSKWPLDIRSFVALQSSVAGSAGSRTLRYPGDNSVICLSYLWCKDVQIRIGYCVRAACVIIPRVSLIDDYGRRDCASRNIG